jgi:hypothetical protein
MYEPWGEGTYINELTLDIKANTELMQRVSEYKDVSNYIEFTILLNSGDNIKILASQLSLIDM